jgi:molybdopterin-guanine dinucleotide biosynthesis protein A
VRSTGARDRVTTREHPPTLGVLLAGGLARRMGGGDKGLKRIGGETIIARVIARLGPQCAGLIVNANGDPARLAFLGLPVVPDDVPGFAGPLAGVLAALDWAARELSAIEWVASAPTDCPFLPRDLVARLHAARRAANVPLACARSGGRTHPPVGLWPVALRADLRRALTVENERKIDRWTARHGIACADWEATPVDPFFNANTPEDLAEAEALLAAHADP